MKTAACVLIASIVGISGCSLPPAEPAPGDNLTVGKVQGEIKVGMSSAAVVEVLGAPNILTTDEKRREVWVYDKVSTDRMNAEASSYGTLIIFGGHKAESRSSARQRTLTVVIKFDEQKLVRDFSYNYTQF